MRGVTILEMLVTLGLMLVVMVVAAGLFTSYTRVAAFSSVRDRSRVVAEDVLLAVRADLEAAQQVALPAPSQLDVVRIDHGLPNRLQPVATGNWLTRSGNFLMKVEYRKVGNDLLRSIVVPASGGSRVDATLAHEVLGFEVLPSPDPDTLGLYRVRITVQGDRHNLLRVAETWVARMTYLP